MSDIILPVISLITAFGGAAIGSWITGRWQTKLAETVSKHEYGRLDKKLDFERKNLNISEKKEAYIGLLKSLHVAAVRPSSESEKEFALWQTRVELVGSVEVCKYTDLIPKTNGDLKARNLAFTELKNAMRRDLEIDIGRV